MNQSRPKVIVVIPLYTTNLSPEELQAFEHNVRILGPRQLIAVVCPDTLDLSPFDSVLGTAETSIERFPIENFAGVAGYNRMMLSEAFYTRFERYRHLLLCQTDAFVFSDRLDEWCSRDYDYIGAPWIASPRSALNRALFRFNNLFRRKKKSDEYLFKVGNGGFSLRKVDTMRRIVSEQRKDIDYALAHPDDSDRHIEDRYISLVAPTKLTMRIPEYHEAVDFCIDRRPALALRLNDFRLPFACHGFNKPNVRAFWQPILQAHRDIR